MFSIRFDISPGTGNKSMRSRSGGAAVGAKMVERKKSQNFENKSNRSKDKATQIVQKNTFCIRWGNMVVIFCIFSKEFNFLRCSLCFGFVCGVVSDFF